MKQVKMRKGYIGAVKIGKHEDEEMSMLSMPNVSQNLGEIKFLASDIKELKVGDKIYFGNQREQIRMAGMDVMIMKLDNVYAVEE